MPGSAEFESENAKISPTLAPTDSDTLEYNKKASSALL